MDNKEYMNFMEELAILQASIVKDTQIQISRDFPDCTQELLRFALIFDEYFKCPTFFRGGGEWAKIELNYLSLPLSGIFNQ